MSMKINVSESQVDETTFKQAVDTFLDYAPEGGWSDYWSMQQDWASFTDGLVRDGTVTDRQTGNWGNPCTPETFKSWQKRNGLTRRPRAWDESKKSEGDASDYVGKYYVDIEDEDEGTLYSSDMEFVSARKASLWAFDELKKSKDDADVFQASVYQLFINDDGDLDHELIEVIHKSDLDESKKSEGAWDGWDGKDPKIGIYYTEDELAILKDVFKKYVQEVSGIRYSVPKDYIVTYDITEDPFNNFNAVVKASNTDNTIYLCNLVGEVVWEPNTPKQFLYYIGQVDPKTGEEKKDKYVIPPRSFFLDDDYYANAKANTRIPLNPSDWDKIDDYFKKFFKQPSESKKSESSRFGAGMATRKDFSKTKNLGEIFDVLDEHLKSLKAASEDMSKSKEDLEASIKKLQEFEGYTDFLKQQSVKGIKKALTLKNSPEVQAASEIEKNLKDALSVIMSDYKNVTDVTQLMVVIDSKYATRGSQILTTLEGQVSRAIDVDMKTIKDSIESGDITEDDVMKLVTMTSVSKGMKNKDTATKVKPVLERMNAMLESASKVEEAIIDPQQFKELRDLVEQIVNEASTPKETIKTTVTALDKETISSVPEAKDGGLLGKLKEFVKAVQDKIAGLWDSFTSLFFSIEDDALEASDVFDEIEAYLGSFGISIGGGKAQETLSKQFEVLTKSVLTCCDNLVKDAALAGEFDDEVIYAEEAVKNAVESFQNLGEACKSLKDSLSYHKNEDNMNVIGILADAITQIVADEEGVIEDEETADAEDDSNSVIDDVERRYSAPGGEQEEPEMGNEEPEMGNEGPELGGEEPEEF